MMLPKIAILLFLFLLFDFKVECHPNGNRKRTKEEQQRNVDVEIDASGQTSAKSRTRKTSPAILSKLSDLSPGEDILWLRGRQDQTDLPTLDAIKILMPDEISKVPHLEIIFLAKMPLNYFFMCKDINFQYFLSQQSTAQENS